MLTLDSSMIAVSSLSPPRRGSLRTALALALAAALALLLAPTGRAGESSRLLWATVNVCDTRANPNTIGVRASMPGTGRRDDRMYMRFRVQFLQPSTERWRTVRRGGDSGWVAVGSARFRARQAGRSFELTPRGARIRLRGVVSFEWRRGDRTVRRERRVTAAGHRSSDGADPAGYSAAECVIRA